MIMKILLQLFILPVFVYGSFLQVNGLPKGDSLKSETSLTDRGQIGYLFFKVEKNSSGLEKITLESRKVADGKLKSIPSFDRNSAGIGDFIVLLTDANGKEIVKQLVEDPLNQNMESFEKEGISRHKVSLETAEFSVRYSYSEEIKTVRIEKITSAGNQILFNEKL